MRLLELRAEQRLLPGVEKAPAHGEPLLTTAPELRSHAQQHDDHQCKQRRPRDLGGADHHQLVNERRGAHERRQHQDRRDERDEGKVQRHLAAEQGVYLVQRLAAQGHERAPGPRKLGLLAHQPPREPASQAPAALQPTQRPSSRSPVGCGALQDRHQHAKRGAVAEHRTGGLVDVVQRRARVRRRALCHQRRVNVAVRIQGEWAEDVRQQARDAGSARVASAELGNGQLVPRQLWRQGWAHRRRHGNPAAATALWACFQGPAAPAAAQEAAAGRRADRFAQTKRDAGRLQPVVHPNVCVTESSAVQLARFAHVLSLAKQAGLGGGNTHEGGLAVASERRVEDEACGQRICGGSTRTRWHLHDDCSGNARLHRKRARRCRARGRGRAVAAASALAAALGAHGLAPHKKQFREQAEGTHRQPWREAAAASSAMAASGEAQPKSSDQACPSPRQGLQATLARPPRMGSQPFVRKVDSGVGSPSRGQHGAGGLRVECGVSSVAGQPTRLLSFAIHPRQLCAPLAPLLRQARARVTRQATCRRASAKREHLHFATLCPLPRRAPASGALVKTRSRLRPTLPARAWHSFGREPRTGSTAAPKRLCGDSTIPAHTWLAPTARPV